jgi:hypothetical protein
MCKWALLGAAIVAAAGACLPGSGPPLNPYTDDAGPPPSTGFGDGGPGLGDVDLGDPFAITGLEPSHGPWTGGTRTTIAGRGFTSKLRVWIGGTELPPSAIFASDPQRAAVLTPPGTPGPVDVKVRDDTTASERTLGGGFTYDAFVVEPSSGATTGGTRISLHGNGTKWVTETIVAVGGKPCAHLAVTDATHLQCTTPAASPGTQDVTTTDPDKTFLQARDAFTYSDSPDGYRGGLYGGALNGNLKVLVFDSWAGTPIAGAKAIAGGNVQTAIVGTTNASGVTQISDPSLTGKVTVTVAAKCHMPITYVDVPVDTVTAYLNPVLDLSCASGDPPSNGNWGGRDGGEIDGELVWDGGIEFQRAPWKNVPLPTSQNERQAAYVFLATTSPLDNFYLPPQSAATTPTSGGHLGYEYAIGAYPGNATVYALAGLEDRTLKPPRFVPFAMGVVRGVPVYPNVKTTLVDIPMRTVLDHQVTTTPNPPPTTQRGPDRLQSSLCVTVGTNEFAILPHGAITSLLPVAGNVSFVGVPALDGTLTGESYNLTAAAVTGDSAQPPSSVVTRIRTTDSNNSITLGGFLPVPVLKEPNSGTWGGTHVSLAVNGSFDLIVMQVSSGNGLKVWQIVAPGGTSAFDLPDLSMLPNDVGLLRGAIGVSVSIARIDGFDYGTLRTGQLYSSAWNAYASDGVSGTY